MPKYTFYKNCTYNSKGLPVLTIKQRRDAIADIVARRFKVSKESVRNWMNREKCWDLNKIIKRSENFEQFLSKILNL